MLCGVCVVQTQPRKYVLDHAGCTAMTSTRQHELDHTDHVDHPDHKSICPEISRSLTVVGIDHADHTDHTDHLSVRCVCFLIVLRTDSQLSSF